MEKNKIPVIIAIIAVLSGGGYWAYRKYAPPDDGVYVACTQEARSCPDGSSVGRIPPRCEFATCPSGGTPLPPEEVIDISTWKTYRNEQFLFEVRYPGEWELKVEKNPIEQRFDIVSPGGSYIGIAPEGWSAGSSEAVRRREEIGVVSGKKASTLIDLTEEGKEWGRMIRFLEYPEGWNEYNFIRTDIDFLSLEEKCAEEITPEHLECGAGDGSLYFGKINKDEEKVVHQVLSTFRFIK